MMKKIFLAGCLAGLMAACSTSPTAQYAIDAPLLETARKNSATIEVLEVSLPLYMQGQEIPVMMEDGSIRTDPSALWADDPARAISLNLAEALSRMSGGVASVEPWPLDERADRRLDVRVKTLLATNQGALKFSGQYFMVDDDGGKPKVDWFDITVPMSERSGRSIARATGIATQRLAELVLAR